MKSFSTSLICACIALSAGTAFAQDGMKKNEPMSKDGMMKKSMTLQECRDHMAMGQKEGLTKAAPTKDDAMMKQEAMCADMMKKDKKPADPMKK